MCGFLSNERQRPIDCGQSFVQECFAVLVRDRDGIIAAFVFHLTCSQVAIARQDSLLGDALHQRENFSVERSFTLSLSKGQER